MHKKSFGIVDIRLAGCILTSSNNGKRNAGRIRCGWRGANPTSAHYSTLEATQMNTQQARQILDQIAATHRANGNLDQAARIELAREYFTNSKFAKALADPLWEVAA